MTGGYDQILQPLVTDNRFDFILFSNDYNCESLGIWKIRHIPEVVINDDKRLSRYPKTHPESLLSEYEYSLYMDANIQIKDSWIYNRFMDLVEKKEVFAGIKLVLTGRDCIYEHAYDMSVIHVEHDYNAVIQCNALYKNKFPRNFGLNENNIIFRHHDSQMQKADEEWWSWIKKYSFRDQFSYMYCLWKYNIKTSYFFPIGEDAHNSSHVNFITHNNDEKVAKKKWLKKSIYEKLRCKALQIDAKVGLFFWHLIYSSRHPIIALHIFCLICLLLMLPKYVYTKLFNIIK